jgi:acyl carrier protein
MSSPTDNRVPDYISRSFAAVLRSPAGTIKRETVADVPGWDSMANINLLLEIESAVGIRFKAAEILQLKNVGELIDVVERKLRAA